MHPTHITLRLALGNCCTSLSDAAIRLGSTQDGESSSDLVDLSSDPGFHGCSLVPFARVLNLVYRYPHIRLLYLFSVTVQHVRLSSTLAQLPWFSLLESLSIKPLFDPRHEVGIVIARGHFLTLLALMPRLRKLRVYGPKGPPHAADAPHDDLPCKLETLLLFGSFPVSTSAHIISQSRSSLRDLRINTRGYAPTDEALLLAAIAQAAPRLRFLALRLRGESDTLPRIEPLVTALKRLDALHFELPRNATLQEALDALGGAPVRALSVHCAGDMPRPRAPSDIDVSRLRMPALRSLELIGFAFDDDVYRELAAYCRARRIRCSIK